MKKRARVFNSKSSLGESSSMNTTVAKTAFVVLMALIFFSILFLNKSGNPLTSLSVLDAVNPGVNFVIFFVFLALVLFLTYERKRLK